MSDPRRRSRFARMGTDVPGRRAGGSRQWTRSSACAACAVDDALCWAESLGGRRGCEKCACAGRVRSVRFYRMEPAERILVRTVNASRGETRVRSPRKSHGSRKSRSDFGLRSPLRTSLRRANSLSTREKRVRKFFCARLALTQPKHFSAICGSKRTRTKRNLARCHAGPLTALLATVQSASRVTTKRRWADEPRATISNTHQTHQVGRGRSGLERVFLGSAV
jgi:hypothetical protein